MKKKNTRVKVKFTFEGWVDVEGSDNKAHAKFIVESGFNAMLEVNKPLDCRMVDWEIDIHPTKVKTS